jgi:parvulin-like peptidyl-prolyl isomerase
MELRDTLIVVNGQPITVQDVVGYLKAAGVFRDSVCRLVELKVIRDTLPALGVAVADEEVYSYADAKRRQARLDTAQAMNDYCRNNGITMDHWLVLARDELIVQKVRAKVVAQADVARYLKEHGDSLRTVAVSRIVCRDGALAGRIARQAAAGESFNELARQCSVEESTRNSGGYLGAVRPRMLPARVDEAVFAARVNDVLGPFAESGYWTVYKVEAIREAEMSGVTRKEIEDRLFKAWLQRAITASRFEKPK